MILSDFGADVIKVEPPTGDTWRIGYKIPPQPRRALLLAVEPRGNAQVIRASVPLAEMFGYTTDLRSMTQGRATSTMHFGRYAEVPENIATTIVAKIRGE